MRRAPVLLACALVLYAVLGALTVNAVGIVGEVALGWSLPSPPRVLVDFQGTLADSWAWGPLHAAQVRPIERLVLGPVELPLAINSYTGGLPDWPSRLIVALGGGQLGAVTLHLLLGGLFIVLVHRFLRFHGLPGSGGLAALILASDWGFVFYRKVLGGTELLLLAAGLLLIWASWSRRWAGGRHGAVAIAVALGLGLLAKATFLPTALAWALAMLLTRRDRPELKPPPAPSWALLAGIVGLLTAPLWVTWLHHGLQVPAQGHIQSHDFLGLQLERAFSGLSGLFSGERAPAREVPNTLIWYLGDPLAWLTQAYGGERPSTLAWLRWVGWSVALAGSVLEWLRPRRDRCGALLRILSLFVPLQILLLWLSNRDLHHLAQATPPLAIWVGLAGTRLAAVRVHPKSWARGVVAGVLSLPLLLPGVDLLRRTDGLVDSGRVPTFSESGQSDLIELLRANEVTRLVASDYDLYGMLEIRAPELQTTHAWGAVSHASDREQAWVELLRLAQGQHLLLIRPSAPMRYNLSPTKSRVHKAQEQSGVTLELVDTLEDGEGTWAWLYKVPPAP
ncbi:MAG: hypothetical protein VX899_07880 [Myxococcota bacterium]|nr:hypothetical protein [Myxococcota bacterium]